MKELKLYMCEHCGTQYKEKEAAKDCEKTHKVVIDIIDASYHAKADYPDRVRVKFSDGTFYWYKR